MRGVIKHVGGLVRFFIDVSADSGVELTGEKSIVLLHDYIESLTHRGRTVPAAAKEALLLRADALGIEWPLTHPLVLSVATVESNECPRQAPPMKLDTARQLESL